MADNVTGLDATNTSITFRTTEGNSSVHTPHTIIDTLPGNVTTDIAAIKTAVEIIDNAVATEGSALGSGILLQGDDGTDRQNVLVDTSGHLQVDVLSGGGGSQYAEDAAHNSGDNGTVALAVRRDTAAVGSGTDGDYSTINVDATGRMWVHDPVVNGTLAGVISGSELQVDIVGAPNLTIDGANGTGNLPVAIAAQSVNLAIDGTAGTGNLPVNIAESVNITIDGANGTGNLPVDVQVVAIPTAGVAGQLTVSNVSTPENLGANTLVSGVHVKALSGNTDAVHVGFLSNVSNSTGYPLYPNESVFIECNNTDLIYVDVDTANDSVAFIGT